MNISHGYDEVDDEACADSCERYRSMAYLAADSGSLRIQKKTAQ
jgi:hypothetical protein